MSKNSEVLIVGGGVIGLTSALFLARAGFSVHIVDRSEFGTEASWAGAGIVPPGNFETAQSGYDQLRAYSSSRFADFSHQLREWTGLDNGYRECGGFEFFEEPEQETIDLWQKEKVAFQKLTAAEIKKLEPNLAPTATGYLLPGMSQIRNPWHMDALIAACQQHRIKMTSDCEIAKWNREGSKISGVTTSKGETISADRFLLANGAWGKSLAEQLGLTIGIHPVRGQIVLFKGDKQLIKRIAIVGKRYIVPRDDGRLLSGATEEPEAGFEKANTSEGVDSLTKFAIDLVPALRDAQIEKTWSGLRPGSIDGMPYLGQIPQTVNAFIAMGHFRAGIQLSLGTAQIVTELMQEKPTTIAIDDFKPDRTVAMSFKPAFRS